MSKITKSAQGEICLVRIPTICNHDPETTIFAHLNGGGMGKKRDDIFGSYCCSACHDVLDGRVQSVYANETLERMHLDGMVRTQEELIKKGLIKCV